MVINRSIPYSEARLLEAVAAILKVPVAQLNPHTDFIDDLYLDPIDRDLLIAKLENKFGVVLSPEEVASIDTVGDAGLCIQRYAA